MEGVRLLESLGAVVVEAEVAQLEEAEVGPREAEEAARKAVNVNSLRASRCGWPSSHYCCSFSRSDFALLSRVFSSHATSLGSSANLFTPTRLMESSGTTFSFVYRGWCDSL